MKYKNKIFIFTLILIIIFSFGAAAGPQDKIKNMNFKNANIVDVLRAVAEVADVNLITDSQIAGSITVNLKDITFKKALDLITKTRGLDYKWDQNTVVVASTERLDLIYNNIVTKYVEFNSADFDNIGTIVKEIFPKTQITIDAARRQFIIKGEKEKTAEIIEMINRLDNASKTEEEIKNNSDINKENESKIYNESYNILNAEIEDLKNKLRAINPKIRINTNPLTGMINLKGPKAEVKKALAMAESYDQSLEPETRNIRVDYVDTEQISEIVGKFYPEINLHVNKKRKEIIIHGAKNKLDNVADLIKEINKPQYQVVIETRVEEISSDFTRELGLESLNGEFNIINGTQSGEKYKINDLDYNWPDVFKALDVSTDTQTLASPRLMTLNGEEADLSILEEVPYKIVETDDNGDETTTWEYADAGVELVFTPWITENNEIELKIAPTVSSFNEISEIGSGEGDTPPPAKKSRSVETTLRLKNDETFAIGGLIQTNNQGKITKIPLLGHLPLFGELFKFREPTDKTNELIIFVTPHIIKYGDEVSTKNVIKPENEDLAADIQKEIKLEEKENKENQDQHENTSEKSEEEIINEYLAERQKEREEILNSIKEDKDEKEEYQDLSPEELEAILEK